MQYILDSVNWSVLTLKTVDMSDVFLDPVKGNVAFGSAQAGWAFTIKRFADVYSKKFGIEPNKMAEKLWGDNFFDTHTKSWVTERTKGSDDAEPRRSFV